VCVELATPFGRRAGERRSILLLHRRFALSLVGRTLLRGSRPNLPSMAQVFIFEAHADVAELADAQVSGTCSLTGVEVRSLSSALAELAPAPLRPARTSWRPARGWSWRRLERATGMPLEDVEKRLRQRPFAPFRKYLNDGAVYEVMHPELVLLGRRSLVLGLTADPQATVYDRTVDVDLLHIVRMENVEPRRARKAK
jgi:hypothetical protein